MDWYLIIILALIAFLYAAVGHGGASGYLAFMALIGTEPLLMKSTALVLNLFVAGIAFISYYRNGFFKLQLLWPFIVTSIPAAFFGSRMSIEANTYKMILGIFLLIAIARMLMKINSKATLSELSYPVALLIGALLGFFSGMIGIGGGIILSPILLLVGWANVKEAAAVSAPFIFLNSLSGILGMASGGMAVVPNFWLWIIIAVTGGLVGAYMGSTKFSLRGLNYLLAIVLASAAFKLILY